MKCAPTYKSHSHQRGRYLPISMTNSPKTAEFELPDLRLSIKEIYLDAMVGLLEAIQSNLKTENKYQFDTVEANIFSFV